MFPDLLTDTRAYRDALTVAFASRSLGAWDATHALARRLIEKYGPVVFMRIDTLAYRYC